MAIATLIRPRSVVGRFALTLNATPPGFLASLGLLAIHAVSFVVAVGTAGALIVLQHRPA